MTRPYFTNLTFTNFILSLIVYLRQLTYKRRGDFALSLSKNTSSHLGKQFPFVARFLADEIAGCDLLLEELEELQKAVMGGGDVKEILRNNEELLNKLYKTSRTDEWFASKYVRKLDKRDSSIMARGCADLLRIKGSIYMAKNKK